MRMMLVGAGAVGESIVKVMQWRDPKGMWLEYVLVLVKRFILILLTQRLESVLVVDFALA